MERRDHVLITFLVPLSFFSFSFFIASSEIYALSFNVGGMVRCQF